MIGKVRLFLSTFRVIYIWFTQVYACVHYLCLFALLIPRVLCVCARMRVRVTVYACLCIYEHVVISLPYILRFLLAFISSCLSTNT